jgi:redox-sensitive bicupin YhaK (pirin superfamily)
MITIRRAGDRGRSRFDWLDSRHTFSFGEYRDPRHMGFHTLRVINDDRVGPGGGFGLHPHRDMEIISYVLEGALEHQDNMGHRKLIPAGDLQSMSAGRGVVHSEFNHSKEEPVHFLQIWILPRERGIPPAYHQRAFPPQEKRGKLRLVAGPKGGEGTLEIHQDAQVFITLLERGDQVQQPIPRGRHVWVHVVRGNLVVNGEPAAEGDGVALESEERLTIEAGEDQGEALVFDLGD